MDDRQYFDVDPSETDEFKTAAGGKARWDSALKRWYMSTDDVRRAPNKHDLGAWRPPHVSWPIADADTDITVQGGPHQCIRCKLSSVAVLGFTIDDDPEWQGTVFDATAGPALKLIADALSGTSPELINCYDELAHLRRRWSKTQGQIYFANCCRTVECEFLFGEFYLHQELERADAEETLIKIARVRVPRYLIDEVTSDYEDD